jgi:hypothetical protein
LSSLVLCHRRHLRRRWAFQRLPLKSISWGTGFFLGALNMFLEWWTMCSFFGSFLFGMISHHFLKELVPIRTPFHRSQETAGRQSGSRQRCPEPWWGAWMVRSPMVFPKFLLNESVEIHEILQTDGLSWLWVSLSKPPIFFFSFLTTFSW